MCCALGALACDTPSCTSRLLGSPTVQECTISLDSYPSLHGANIPCIPFQALFQALGSLRERDIPRLEAAAEAAAALDARAAVGASAGAEGARPGLPTGQQKRGRGAAGSSGSGGGSGAHKPGKRARRGVQEGEEEGGQVLDQQQPQYEMHEQVGQPRQQAGFGGATADALQRGAANTAAFASTSMLAKTQLADMLKNLAAMQQQL